MKIEIEPIVIKKQALQKTGTSRTVVIPHMFAPDKKFVNTTIGVMGDNIYMIIDLGKIATNPDYVRYKGKVI